MTIRGWSVTCSGIFPKSAENIAHGLSQAMLKRGLPRAAMSDNGAAMTATEISEGLARLGILHQTTLPYSPFVYVAPAVMWRFAL